MTGTPIKPYFICLLVMGITGYMYGTVVSYLNEYDRGARNPDGRWSQLSWFAQEQGAYVSISGANGD